MQFLVLVLLARCVTLPDVLQSFRQRLSLHRAVGVPGIARKNELIVITPRSEHLRHILICEYPIVISVVSAEIVAIAYFHPEANRLHGAVRDDVLVKLPRTMRSCRVEWRLLV